MICYSVVSMLFTCTAYRTHRTLKIRTNHASSSNYGFRSSLLDPNHVEVAASLSNNALILKAQSKLDEALLLASRLAFHNDKNMKLLRNCAIVPRVQLDEFYQDVKLTTEVRRRLYENGDLQVHVTWEEQNKYGSEAK